MQITKMYQEGNTLYGDCLMADGVVHEKRIVMPLYRDGASCTFELKGTYEFLEDFIALINSSLQNSR